MFKEWKYFIFLLQSFWLNCLGSDLYSDDVRKYDAEAFKQNVGGDKPHFVNFFAPWCGYCKRLKPVWDELAEKYNVGSIDQKVVIVKIDCTVETPLCADQGVSGYPSLIFYTVGSAEGMKYKGRRDLTALEEFIGINIGGTKRKKVALPVKVQSAIGSPQGALELTDENFHSTVDWGLHFVKFYAPWCGHCQTLAPLWDELAENSQLDSSVTISKVDCTVNRIACSEFEVKAFPTLLWIVNGKKVEKFQGQRTLLDMKRFIAERKRVVKEDPENEDGKVPEITKQPAELVVQLTGGNFENAVSRGLTFVKFFAPWCGHCRRLAPTWDDLARKFVTQGSIKVAKVDCTIDDALCNKYKVQGYPTLLMFKDGKHMTEYSGIRDLESLHNFVQDHLLPRDEL